MSEKTNNQYENLYGLIGRPLGHSFSKKYFAEKFDEEGRGDCFYDLFPLGSIHYLNILRRDNENLKGINVTIPYKESVLDFLDELDDTAKKIGAVNTIKCEGNKYIGYNTDALGFEESLKEFIASENLEIQGVLILGSGGASKAVKYVSQKMNLPHKIVSRDSKRGDLTYEGLDQAILNTYNLVVNTTPLGTYPKVKAAPAIPYDLLSPKNALYDLVYNPEKTLFLEKGIAKGCATINGSKMLKAQAEMAWKIWTTN